MLALAPLSTAPISSGPTVTKKVVAVDSRIQKTVLKTAGASTRVSLHTELNTTVSAVCKITIEKLVTVTAKVQGFVKSDAVSAVLLLWQSKNAQATAIVQQQGRIKTTDMTGVLWPGWYTYMDAVLHQFNEREIPISGVLQKSITKTTSITAVRGKRSLKKTVASSCVPIKLGRQQLILTDAILLLQRFTRVAIVSTDATTVGTASRTASVSAVVIHAITTATKTSGMSASLFGSGLRKFVGMTAVLDAPPGGLPETWTQFRARGSRR